MVIHQERRPTQMTQAQKKILRWFAETNTGAILFEGSWIFPQHVRDDADLAARMAA